MTQPGLRLLALDGGGTRGLTTLYILRELMGGIAPTTGGDVRPCEYFDLIGGSGLSGLCALLFVRFCYTVDQAISFLHDLVQKLDDVENFRLKIMQGDVEEIDDWLDCMNRERDPVDQLAALRQGMVQDAWSNAIIKNITDGLETYLHMENGEFNYKSPLAETETGRSKAFAVSSESRGYGDNGGFSDSRQYNVPLLNRTYKCRDGRSRYTMYAVGLATVASPDIMKPGVVFPDFLATGRHTAHNSVNLILEESRSLWPGVRVGALVSIAGGKFEIEETISTSTSLPAIKACAKIQEDNQALAAKVQRHVLPYDETLNRSYFRFDTHVPLAFLESKAKNVIEDEVKEYLSSAEAATKCARAANVLKGDDFPNTAEDQVSLSSLASLLHTLVVAGYACEAVIVTDIISNFILSEAASEDGGGFRKVAIATEAEKLAAKVRHTHQIREAGHYGDIQDGSQSAGAFLLDSMAFGSNKTVTQRPLCQLQTLSDIAAAAYYCLAILRRGDHAEINSPSCGALLRQLAVLVDTHPDITQLSISRMESILELATVAALCEAASAQALRAYKGLSHNSSCIRHIYKVLLDIDLVNVSLKILGPIANFLAFSIHVDNWSAWRDDAIVRLLNEGSTRTGEMWSFVNLALERQSLEDRLSSDSKLSHSEVMAVCEAFLGIHARAWSAQSAEIISFSAENGYFELLKKYLSGDPLTPGSQATVRGLSNMGKFGDNGETVFHQCARLGFPYVLKAFIGCIPLARTKELVNYPNSQGQTPLHLACIYRAPKELFRLLYCFGADINTRCHQGRTALHYCFPDQSVLPAIYDKVIDLASEHSLITITPLDKPQIFVQGACKPVEPRVSAIEEMVNKLLGRRADMCITDNEGMSPLHTAAKNGWGDNLGLFFRLEGENWESQQRTCLKLRDNANSTLLDYTRRSEIREGMNRGEDLITEEMSKRGMSIPAKSAYDLWYSQPQWTKVRLGRSRTPVQDDDIQSSYNIPRATPSPQPGAAMSPVFVYQDPDIQGGANHLTVPYEQQNEPNHNISIRVSSPPPAYHDPSHFPKVSRKPVPIESRTGAEFKQRSSFLDKFRKVK